VQLARGGYLEITAPALDGEAGRYPIEVARPTGPTRGWPGIVPPLRAGFARIGPLPTGPWTVEVDADGRKLVATVVVESGRTVAVDLR
jgi:hypothetical protein